MSEPKTYLVSGARMDEMVKAEAASVRYKALLDIIFAHDCGSCACTGRDSLGRDVCRFRNKAACPESGRRKDCPYTEVMK